MELIGGLEPPPSLELLPNDRNGNVISHTVNYNNKGKDRYIIAGMGTVESASSVLGAMIESYPNNKNYNHKIYLHEVAIKKEDDKPFKTGSVQNGTPSGKSSSIYSLLQELQNVNENSKKSLSEQDSSYQNAVDEGNSEQAQRLVDDAAMRWGAYSVDGNVCIENRNNGREFKDITKIKEVDAGDVASKGSHKSSTSNSSISNSDKNVNKFSLSEDDTQYKNASENGKPYKTEYTDTRVFAKYHNPNSYVQYAYIEDHTQVNGKSYQVKIAVRKSLQKNKFWVHQIYVDKKSTNDRPAGENFSKTGLLAVGDENNIAQNTDDVKHEPRSEEVQSSNYEQLLERNAALEDANAEYR